jgi:hypothetical protein
MTPKFENPPPPPPKNNLDLIELAKEKDRLKKLIEPAILQFFDAIGLVPSISVGRKTQETRCGIYVGALEVEISIVL